MFGAKLDSTALVSAAFQAILAGHTPPISDLGGPTTSSSNDVNRLVGRSLMLDADGRVVAAAGLSLVPRSSID